MEINTTDHPLNTQNSNPPNHFVLIKYSTLRITFDNCYKKIKTCGGEEMFFETKSNLCFANTLAITCKRCNA